MLQRLGIPRAMGRQDPWRDHRAERVDLPKGLAFLMERAARHQRHRGTEDPETADGIGGMGLHNMGCRMFGRNECAFLSSHTARIPILRLQAFPTAREETRHRLDPLLLLPLGIMRRERRADPCCMPAFLSCLLGYCRTIRPCFRLDCHERRADPCWTSPRSYR